MRPTLDEVSARETGQWFSTDPELAMPTRPRLIPELLVLPLGDDGVLFVGSAEPQALRGRSARGALLRLLPLLDGEHTLAEIIAQSRQLSAGAVRDAVSLLFSRGLLEDGAPELPLGDADTAAFIGRHIDASRRHPNRSAAMRDLAAAVVRLIGPEWLTTPMAAELRRCGVAVTPAGDPSHPDSVPTLTIVLSTGSTAEVTGRHRQNPGEHTLLVRLGREEAHLGPHLIEGVTACPTCVARAHPHPGGDPSELATRLWTSQAAHLAFLLLTGLPPGPALRGFRRQTLVNGELTEQTRLTARLPGCSACAMPALDWAPEDPRLVSWVYHCATSVPSRDVLSPKDHQGHYVHAYAQLASEGPPPILGARRADLSGLGETLHRLPTPATGQQIDANTLAALLVRTAGTLAHGGQLRRLVPTGGNLGSVDCWVVVRRVPGLTPGAYRYDAVHHAFDYIRAVDDGDLHAALATDAPLPAALVVGTGALAKCAAKYQAFAYRLIHLDAGVSLAYLHLSAAALGIAVCEYPDFTPALAEALGIRDRWESPLPTFAAGIVDHRSTDRSPRRRRTEVPAIPEQPLQPSDHSFDILSRLVANASHPPPTPAPPSEARPEPPAPAYGSLDELDPVILARRARRIFAERPVPPHVAEQLLTTARLASTRRLSAGAPPCFVTPVLAVASRTDGFAAGLYQAASDGGIERRAGFDRTVAERCSNQAALAAAPLTLFAIGDLPAAVTMRGARGYAELAEHAGSLVGEAWLAATRLGLVGTAAGGVIPGGLRVVAGMDGFTECPMLALHLGLPSEEPW